MEGWEGIVQCRLLDDGNARGPSPADTSSQSVFRSRMQRTLHWYVKIRYAYIELMKIMMIG